MDILDEPKSVKRKRGSVQSTLHYSSQVEVIHCNPLSSNSDERLFKYKLQDSNNNVEVLDCYIMNNSVCVVKLSAQFQYEIKSFTYLVDYNEDDVQGKKKKSAIKLQPGSPICHVTTTSGESLELCSPVGGQLLEVNNRFQSQPELLLDKTNQSSYIAIIFPNVTFPDFSICDESSSLVINELLGNKRGGERVCFDWMKFKTCSRGDKCKFLHSNLS